MVPRLEAFLRTNNIKYITMAHSPAYTAQEVAELVHVPGHKVAKTILLKIDEGLAMAVLPASEVIHFAKLQQALGAGHIELAPEQECSHVFPDSDSCSMPPFGNLYGIPVFVADSLAREEQIVFNTGSFGEVARMHYSDYKDLVRPREIDFSVPQREEAKMARPTHS